MQRVIKMFTMNLTYYEQYLLPFCFEERNVNIGWKQRCQNVYYCCIL